MERIINLLKSKKFWTLVASIVAALSAFFLTSCSVQGSLIRKGLHHDTVIYEYKFRSKSAAFSALCQQRFPRIDFPSILTSVPFTSVSSTSIALATTMSPVEMLFRGSSIPKIDRSVNSIGFSTLSTIIRSSIPDSSLTIFSPMVLRLESPVPDRFFGKSSFLAIFPMLFFKKSRRGGRRKGRPKSTKTIPLGGSHL